MPLQIKYIDVSFRGGRGGSYASQRVQRPYGGSQLPRVQLHVGRLLRQVFQDVRNGVSAGAVRKRRHLPQGTYKVDLYQTLFSLFK